MVIRFAVKVPSLEVTYPKGTNEIEVVRQFLMAVDWQTTHITLEPEELDPGLRGEIRNDK